MAVTENFPSTGDQSFHPARRAVVVVKSDSNELSFVTKGLYIGGAGDVAVTMYDGTTVTFSNVSASTVLPIMVKKVMSTNTTATNILGLG